MKVVSAAIAGVILATPAYAGRESIKIGFVAPLSGVQAILGRSSIIAAEIAVEQANRDGGVRDRSIELLVADDRARPDYTVAVTTKLIKRDQVTLVVSGSSSSSAFAAATVLQRARVPFISTYAADSRIAGIGDYIFSTSVSDEARGWVAVEFIGRVLNGRNMAVIMPDRRFGRLQAANFKHWAGNVGIRDIQLYDYNPGAKDFGPMLSRIRATNPDAIYVAGFAAQIGRLLRQLGKRGVTVPVIADEPVVNRKLMEIAGNNVQKLFIPTSLDRDTPDEDSQRFFREFEERAGSPADAAAAYAYTAVKIAISAMRKAYKGDRRSVRDAIASSEIETPTGRISFDRRGQAYRKVHIQERRNGSWPTVKTIDLHQLMAARKG